ncbi:hypothetical protein ACLM5H_04970 [Fredinandcohnia humi]
MENVQNNTQQTENTQTTAQNEQTQANQTQQQNNDSKGKKHGIPDEIMIPKTRFDEINTKYKEVQSKLDELLAEKQEADKKAKEEQGKFEELYKSTSDELNKTKDDFTKSSERVQTLENVINGLLEAKLNDVPEEFHDLIPSYMSPEQKLEWLANAEQKGLFGNKKQEEPVGESTNPSNAQTSDLNKLSPIQLLKAAYGRKA